MTITAKQIADGLQGKLIGNPLAEVSNIAKIEEGNTSTISFLANEKYLSFLKTTQSPIVLISQHLVPEYAVKPTLIVVEDAQKSFVSLLEMYNQMKNQVTGIHTESCIEESAKVGEEVYIGAFVYLSENSTIGNHSKIYPNCYIGKNVQIGENVTIEPNVVIFHDCLIGNNVTIHSGTIIGSDGFGFLPEKDGYRKVPQLGNVIIEDHVEIGSNCTIDRATMGSTILKKGAKLDNLIQIAHNVEIGSHTVIAAQAGIAGSTKIGEWNMIGGQVGIVGHIKIGNQTKIQAQSGVNNNVPDHAELYGSPAFNANDFRKSYVYFKNIKSLAEKLNTLEKEIALLKSNQVQP